MCLCIGFLKLDIGFFFEIEIAFEQISWNSKYTSLIIIVTIVVVEATVHWSFAMYHVLSWFVGHN